MFQKTARTMSVVIAVVVATAGFAPSALATPSTTQAESIPGIFVVTTNGQSLTEGILTEAAADPDYRQRATALVASWSRSVSAGEAPELADLSLLPPSEQVAQLDSLENVLQSSNNITVPAQPSALPVKREATASSVPAGSIGGPIAPGGGVTDPSAVNPDDPNSFVVRGQPGGTDLTYWLDIQLIVEGKFCSFSCEVTDRYISRVTVTPAATTSMINSTNVYELNGGAFSDPYLTLYSINNGALTKPGEDANGLAAADTRFLTNGYPLNGTYLTVAAALTVFVNPYDQYISEGGKTADALCRVTDNNCAYAA